MARPPSDTSELADVCQADPGAVRVVLKPRRAKPFFARHPWVFSGAVDRVEGTPRDGQLVTLVSAQGHVVARGFFNSASQIRVRLVTWSADQPIDEAFWRERIIAAVRLRRQTLGLDQPDGACRLVYSDSDGLPGLVADRYGAFVVVQWTSLGMAAWADIVVPLLAEAAGARGVYQRTERQIREREGLELECGVLAGDEPPEEIVVAHGPIRYAVDIRRGQKTGLFLDQLPNYRAVGRLCRGRRVLDLFAYGGGFGLWAAHLGAREVVAVDVSAAAVAQMRRNAELNAIASLTAVGSDAFAFLAEQAAAGERFDAVVIDPPKFARTTRAVPAALRAYRELVLGALKLLTRDGILVVCSCSQHIGAGDLVAVLQQAAVEADRTVQLLGVRGQGPDHPVVTGCPETAYLDVLISWVS